MNFKSQTMKRAWAIRKLAAVKYGCHCNQISWKECLQMAVAEETTLLLGWEGYEMETFHFETTRAAGKFANGYHTLFATGIVEGETLTISAVNFPFVPRGKMANVEADVTAHIALKAPGYGNVQVDYWGIYIPKSVKVIKGYTYQFREIWKKLGFTWSSELKIWKR